MQAIGEATPESVPARLRDLATALSARVTSTMADYDAAGGLEHSAGEALARARTVDEHRRRGSRALARTAVLDGAAADHEARVHALAAAERAAAVGGHLAAHARMVAEEEVAAERAEQSRTRVAATATSNPSAGLLDVEEVGRATEQVLAFDETVAGMRASSRMPRLARTGDRTSRRGSERSPSVPTRRRPSSRWPSSSTSG